MKLFESLAAYPVSPFRKFDGAGKECATGADYAGGVRVIFDENTGLYWEVKSPNESDVNFGGKTFTFSEAADVHASELNTAKFGGYDDWRVPNKDELRSIMDYSRTDGVIPLIFGNCPVGDYWTKNVYRLQDYFSWVLYSGFGSGIAKRQDAKNFVLAVRSGNDRRFGESDASRFTDNGDGTVTDAATGLMWQKDTNPRMGPKQAEKFCANLSLAGYSDWRLPNIKELNTILNLDVNAQSWLFSAFPMPQNEAMLHYAANGVFENHFAWVTNFTMGYDGYYGGRDAPLLSRAVRYADGAKPAPASQTEKKPFVITHTGQTKAFDLKGREVAADRIWGLDAERVWTAQKYTAEEDGKAVRDEQTGLLWDNAHEDVLLTWNEAHEYVRALNDMHYLGKTDWRLPGREELRSIAVYDDGYPAIDRALFPNAKGDCYWTGVSGKTDSDLAWGIYFGYGCSVPYPKTRRANVRAVSGGDDPFRIPSKERFIVNADKTVTDTATGLMWMQEETPLLKQKDALVFCKELRLGGYDDWVMPSLKELATLINLYEGSEWFFPELFPDTNTKPQGFYQSSTVFGGTFGWGCNFQFGFDGYYADRMNGAYPFRPMRRITKEN